MSITRRSFLILSAVAAGTMLTGCGATGSAQSSAKKVKLMLDHDYRVDDILGFLSSKYPDVDFDVFVGRNGATYLKKAADNKDMASVIISSGTWGRSGAELGASLYDLSATDVASNFYTVYLDNYTTSDGKVYWLPGCSAIEGVMANKDLFDQHGIALPTDYPSFVEVCKKFTELGIRPYASDYKYDYTCAYLLQSWSIPLLQSKEGKAWRTAYESGETDTLDESLGLKMFEKLDSIFKMTGVTADDASRGYGATLSEFKSGKIAMIRQSTNNKDYHDAGMNNLVILPYLGDTADDGWYFTTPGYAVGMNGSLKGGAGEDLCLDIVRTLFSQECMNLFAEEVQSFTAYNKGISFQVKDEFKNIVPYVELNHLYTYISQDKFQSSSKTAVQKMIKDGATPAEALAAFNQALAKETASEPVVATFETGYSREWASNGNKAMSAIANTLSGIAGCDIMLAPFTIHTSSVYSGDYTATELDNLLLGGGISFYKKELTGADVKKLVSTAVSGAGTKYDPVSLSTLPVVSGCKMVVSKDKGGTFKLEDLQVNGKSIDSNSKYSFVYADTSTTLLKAALSWKKEEHDGKDVALSESTKDVDLSAYEGFIFPAKHAADLWKEYFQKGGKLSSPSDYIQVK